MFLLLPSTCQPLSLTFETEENHGEDTICTSIKIVATCERRVQGRGGGKESWVVDPIWMMMIRL